jgi:malate dehydrogenase
VSEAVKDDTYLQNEFITTVQQRGAEVIKARKLSSAASAAKAIVDHIHDWVFGTPEGEFVSMAVYSDGSYGIKEGLIYSFPVTTKDGEYKIVQGLSISEFSRKKMDATAAELEDEKGAAAEFLQ